MPHITINQAPLYYEVNGIGKVHIVCIHGMGLSHINWMEQVPFFSRKAKILTYDIRGHGRSGASPRHTSSKNYLQVLIDDLYGLLAALEFQPVFIIAYSSGCSIALQFMKQYPELVWGAALSGAFDKVSNAYMYSKLYGGLLLGKLHLKNWLSNQVAKANGANEEQIELFRYEAKKIRWKEAQQWIHACLQFDMTQQLTGINIPILLLYGGNERHMMEYRHHFLLSLHNTEICLIPKINHACPTKGRDIFNLLVDDFIESHRPSKTLSTFDSNQYEGDTEQNPQNFSKRYFISNPNESDHSRRNQNEWTY